MTDKKGVSDVPAVGHTCPKTSSKRLKLLVFCVMAGARGSLFDIFKSCDFKLAIVARHAKAQGYGRQALAMDLFQQKGDERF